MKILVLTNLYPPHHAGLYDFRCKSVVDGLVARRHEIKVLTSNHGMIKEQRDQEIERRLRLNGVFGHSPITRFNELKELELFNNASLREAVRDFSPELIYVWSLHGLSKSLIFTLHHLMLPVAYDVADYWISNELSLDPWLGWWNRPKLPFAENMLRSSLELTGQREKLDEAAPTRDRKDVRRLSHIYDEVSDLTGHQPNTITTFRFDRVYFSSQAMRDNAIQTGYNLNKSIVIHPGIPTKHYYGPVKPANSSANRLLIVTQLHNDSGVMTALKALSTVRAQNDLTSLSVYGRGDSEYVAQLRSFSVRAELPVVFQNVSDPVRDMPAVYRQHDIFLHPAEWAEPYTPTQMEAMAAGLPVISTGFGGAGEILRNAENALLFEPTNDHQLAERILALQSQGELRNRIATAGQAEVMENYDDAQVLDRIEAFLNQARHRTEYTPD